MRATEQTGNPDLTLKVKGQKLKDGNAMRARSAFNCKREYNTRVLASAIQFREVVAVAQLVELAVCETPLPLSLSLSLSLSGRVRTAGNFADTFHDSRNAAATESLRQAVR